MSNKLVVEVISKEIVKPSSPTPSHLKNFKLSLLDQFTPPIYIQTILFYPLSDDIDQVNAQKTNLLKKSLSETLTHFYPLAGRIKDNILVDCNDEGVDYFEAKVNGKMTDFMNPNDVHTHLLPCHDRDSNKNNLIEEPLLRIQVNTFDCGGIAIAILMSHKIGDASTITSFINTWALANSSRFEDIDILCPTFDSASLFPPTELLSSSLNTAEAGGETIKMGDNVVKKRFVFDGSKLTILRARIAATSTTMKYPTRVEAVSALIWKLAMEVTKVKSKSISSILNHIVNLRARMNPPLTKVLFGNLVTLASAEWVETEEKVAPELDELVKQLRLAISKIDEDYIEKLKDFGGFLMMSEESSGVKEEKGGNGESEREVYWVSSWCKFPLYETNFGWGMPMWVGSGTINQFKNSFILMDTRCGEGIEVLVCLEEEDMAIFESLSELHEYSCVIDG